MMHDSTSSPSRGLDTRCVTDNRCTETPFLLFFRGHLDVCRDLIEAGANPNTEDGQNRTPMWIAVDSNRAGVVRLLCETGAHTSQAGPEGRTPLHIAARKGFIECAELLLKHGAVVEGNPDK